MIDGNNIMNPSEAHMKMIIDLVSFIALVILVMYGNFSHKSTADLQFLLTYSFPEGFLLGMYLRAITKRASLFARMSENYILLLNQRKK